MLLYNTLLCKKIARATAGHKKVLLTRLGGGGRNRIDPKFLRTMPNFWFTCGICAAFLGFALFRPPVFFASSAFCP